MEISKPQIYYLPALKTSMTPLCVNVQLLIFNIVVLGTELEI
jgi:hypothetical protein